MCVHEARDLRDEPDGGYAPLRCRGLSRALAGQGQEGG